MEKNQSKPLFRIGDKVWNGSFSGYTKEGTIVAYSLRGGDWKHKHSYKVLWPGWLFSHTTWEIEANISKVELTIPDVW